MALQHPGERKREGRAARFEKLAELASNFTSSAVFSLLCVLLVAGYVATHAAGLSTEWQHLAGDAMAAVSLLLLALLKNSERRAEHAIQRKLDAIAAALLQQQEGKEGEIRAREDLESAIGMEERL
ncbi:low affinity iron permease family protein [Streptomyces sp. KS 21]|uniref:low affinity iron permease family protein n=1 Tax=Streptomyces sp. KS 21 TaxID=2485150 RepID=UPI001062C232|nr:low affinity iron permease family protein [Streptomyces sp. KS 21]TDU74168.1 low affinity Fe/Cu permease [Streptomyces sp. KS 21]